MIASNTTIPTANLAYFHRFSDNASLLQHFRSNTLGEPRTASNGYVVRQVPSPGLYQGPVGVNLDVTA